MTGRGPLQNRVTPFGTLIATTARGTLTGNRGCLHDDRKRVRHGFRGKRWIICLLEFNGRRRKVMSPGLYTELFFFDEATALGAGHRPCAECQRARFNLFRDLWALANPDASGTARPSASSIDEVLHRERLGPRADAPPFSLQDLPDGTFVSGDDTDAFLVHGRALLRWTPFGYEKPDEPPPAPTRIVTPSTIVRALAAGYAVTIDPSADKCIRSAR